MSYIKINQEKAADRAELAKLCPFGAIEDKGGRLEINAGCRMCRMCIKKGGGVFEPRLPSYRKKLATADREITWLKLGDLEDTDPKHYGLNGSPTQVKRIFPPESHVEHVMIEGGEKEQAARLSEILAEKKFLQQT